MSVGLAQTYRKLLVLDSKIWKKMGIVGKRKMLPGKKRARTKGQRALILGEEGCDH
jgi:hypothetical protein